jgi:hypothetical protein
LKQNHTNYTKKVSEIDRKSDQRERKKLDELINKSTEMDIKTPKIEQNRTIPEETNKDSELYNMWKQWDYYRTSFPSQKYIWVHNFPEWFVIAMNEIENG